MNYYNKKEEGKREVRVEIKILSLNTPREVVLYDQRDAKTLTTAILHYKDYLRDEKDAECFEHFKNIIWTDSGIFVALYQGGTDHPVVQEPLKPVGHGLVPTLK